MTAIQFYHLTASPLERALPRLLEKAYAGGFKTLLVAESDEQVEQLNQLLWTYDPNSFLPHGSLKDGHADQHPILLSTRLETLNQASLLVITDGRQPENPAGFERILDIFDGRDGGAVAAARTRWADYKNANYALTYLRQSEQGAWEQKAVA